MFTGIVEETGTVDRLEPHPTGARIRVRCRVAMEGAFEGASIAVNGVCLTAVHLRQNSFAADLSPETLRRSNLGDLKTRDIVNLERPLSPSGRLGGHIVQGHVDGRGRFRSVRGIGDGNWWLEVQVPPEVERYCVFKGSIAIDGISLTIAALEGDILSATILPHTYTHTNLHARRPGDALNMECDILAKYVEKFLTRPDTSAAKPERLTEEKLRELGY
jgi:riboflavin synthase